MAVEIDRVPGLFFTPEVLTEEQEESLLSAVKLEPGKPVAQIHPAGEYGWPFFRSSGGLSIDDCYGMMPTWIQEAWAACVAGGNMPACVPRQLPDHVLANTYPIGDGCPAHTDDRHCWTDFVVGLSLGSGATMEFRRGAEPPVRVFLPRRSMYVLTGPARWEYTHAVIAAVVDDVGGEVIPRWERVSLTFRNIARLREQLEARRGVAAAAPLPARGAHGSAFQAVGWSGAADDPDADLDAAIAASLVGGDLQGQRHWPRDACFEGDAADSESEAAALAAALAASMERA